MPIRDSVSLERGLEQVATHVFETLPSGAAELEIGKTPDGALAMSLKPASRKSALVRIYAKDGHPNPIAWVGIQTPIELPSSVDEACSALERILLTIIRGGFKEDVWERNGNVTKTIGYLDVDGRTAKYHYWSGGGSLFRQGDKTTIQYRDYLAPQVD